MSNDRLIIVSRSFDIGQSIVWRRADVLWNRLLVSLDLLWWGIYRYSWPEISLYIKEGIADWTDFLSLAIICFMFLVRKVTKEILTLRCVLYRILTYIYMFFPFVNELNILWILFMCALSLYYLTNMNHFSLKIDSLKI